MPQVAGEPAIAAFESAKIAIDWEAILENEGENMMANRASTNEETEKERLKSDGNLTWLEALLTGPLSMFLAQQGGCQLAIQRR